LSLALAAQGYTVVGIELTPTAVALRIPGIQMPSHDFDDKGRITFPAYLLTAHKAG
jgi:hypothetical protein